MQQLAFETPRSQGASHLSRFERDSKYLNVIMPWRVYVPRCKKLQCLDKFLHSALIRVRECPQSAGELFLFVLSYPAAIVVRRIYEVMPSDALFPLVAEANWVRHRNRRGVGVRCRIETTCESSLVAEDLRLHLSRKDRKA